MDRYDFDIAKGTVTRLHGHGPSESFLRIAVALGGSVATEDRVVAGALDRIEQLPRLDRGGKRGRRRFGREIDAGFDTGDAAQRLFDTSRAGGAGHPLEGDLDPASGFGRRNGKRGIHRSMVYPRWVYVKRCAAKGAG
jgi:hypothetical protein